MKLLKKIPLAFKFLGDKDVKFRKKLPIILGAIYFISPIDFLPEAVLLHFGIIDDITVIGFVLAKFNEELNKYIDEKGLNKKYGKRKGKVIDFVEYDKRREEE